MLSYQSARFCSALLGSAATCRQHLRGLGSAGERDRDAPPAPPVPRTLCPFCNNLLVPPVAAAGARRILPLRAAVPSFPWGKSRVVPSHPRPGRPSPFSRKSSRKRAGFPDSWRTSHSPPPDLFGLWKYICNLALKFFGGSEPQDPSTSSGKKPGAAILSAAPPAWTAGPSADPGVNFYSFAFVSRKTPPCH